VLYQPIATVGEAGTLWESLPWKGYYADEYEKLELRDCSCGSTLAVIVERYKEDEDEYGEPNHV